MCGSDRRGTAIGRALVARGESYHSVIISPLETLSFSGSFRQNDGQHRGGDRQRTAGSMPLLRIKGSAAGADMKLIIALAASGSFATVSRPAANTT